MSADWKAGDKALCVKFTGIGMVTKIPIEGDKLIVGTIYLVTAAYANEIGKTCLHVAGMVANYDWPQRGYSAACFRKIVPAYDRVTVEVEQEAAQ